MLAFRFEPAVADRLTDLHGLGQHGRIDGRVGRDSRTMGLLASLSEQMSVRTNRFSELG